MSFNNQTGETDMQINPIITQQFVAEIRRQSENGTRLIEFNMGGKNIKINIFPNVFPPQAIHSISSKCVFETLGNLTGKLVADIGCGTGIESIVAALCGATHVDAVDISSNACDCARHNVAFNNLQNKISVFQGDLFSVLPQQKYDLIIANLPMVDYQPENEDEVAATLYDPGWKLCRQLFAEGRNYLVENGEIMFARANLQSMGTDNPQGDFQRLEKIIMDNHYDIVRTLHRWYRGYEWISYLVKMNS